MATAAFSRTAAPPFDLPSLWHRFFTTFGEWEGGQVCGWSHMRLRRAARPYPAVSTTRGVGAERLEGNKDIHSRGGRRQRVHRAAVAGGS